MIGRLSKRTWPPFSRAKSWCVDHKALVLLVVDYFCLQATDVGSMGKFGLCVTAKHLILVHKWLPLSELLITCLYSHRRGERKYMQGHGTHG
jgi:hypothetical protein